MGERGPFRAAGRAAGVEQPRAVGREPFHHRGGRTGGEPRVVGIADGKQMLDLRKLLPQRREDLRQIRGREAQARAGILEDERELLRVQARIHRHRHQAGMPAGEQDLDVLRRVAHRERDAVAGRQPETLLQRAREAGDAPGERPVVRDRPVGEIDRRPVRKHLAGAAHEVGEVQGVGSRGWTQCSSVKLSLTTAVAMRDLR